MQVIITRAGDDAQATARQVAALGCTPVPAPLASRLAMPVTLPDQAFDGIIITSRAGLAMLDQAQRAPLQSIPVFCAGDASAALARQAGFATVLSATSDVAGLINLINHTLPQGRSLLYLTGEPRKPDIEQAFAGTMRLTTLVTYMMQTARVFPPEALALLVDPHPVWLHYSQIGGSRGRFGGGQPSARSVRPCAASADLGGLEGTCDIRRRQRHHHRGPTSKRCWIVC